MKFFVDYDGGLRVTLWRYLRDTGSQIGYAKALYSWIRYKLFKERVLERAEAIFNLTTACYLADFYVRERRKADRERSGAR